MWESEIEGECSCLWYKLLLWSSWCLRLTITSWQECGASEGHWRLQSSPTITFSLLHSMSSFSTVIFWGVVVVEKGLVRLCNSSSGQITKLQALPHLWLFVWFSTSSFGYFVFFCICIRKCKSSFEPPSNAMICVTDPKLFLDATQIISATSWTISATKSVDYKQSITRHWLS